MKTNFVILSSIFMLGASSCSRGFNIEGKWKQTAGTIAANGSREFYPDGRCIQTMELGGQGLVLTGKYLLTEDSLFEYFKPNSFGYDTARWGIESFESNVIVLNSGRTSYRYERLK